VAAAGSRLVRPGGWRGRSRHAAQPQLLAQRRRCAPPFGRRRDPALFVEWTNTRAGSLSDDVAPGATYRHHLYPQGYTHDGALLGHPVGGDVVAAAAGALVERGPFAASAVLARGRATSAAQRFVPGPLEAVNANLQLDLGDGHCTGVGAWWLRSAGWRGASAQWWWQYAWP
jgi:hypothetical protein